MPSISGHRWYTKKAARQAIGVAAALATSARRLGGSAAPAVRVLTYHCFGPGVRDPFCLDPASFEQQMRWLAERRKAVSLDDVRSFVAGRSLLEDGSILVTIDDGDAGIADHAWPILKRCGIPAVAFVIAGELGAPGRLSAAQVRRLAADGLEIGSHTLTHPSMVRIPREQARTEAEQSRRLLEEVVGKPVTAFAYPYGTLADFDEEVVAILAGSGYDCAFTSQHGAIRPTMPGSRCRASRSRPGTPLALPAAVPRRPRLLERGRSDPVAGAAAPCRACGCLNGVLRRRRHLMNELAVSVTGSVGAAAICHRLSWGRGAAVATLSPARPRPRPNARRSRNPCSSGRSIRR
jgi:peptidoglycan/xylan/chitin deacetylase (PgdA/CDA1 family)